ncbi:hypothetical protein FSP39_018826 [Pinctada imbricata]|uniref:Uncharacterized protein n=1 Tax=Pinctada imbricata TaxID=66713 RepID=A0AA88YLQ8_PINIB|nr:hypothetical protein FSP39_018826 [Pinctada imbricata]
MWKAIVLLTLSWGVNANITGQHPEPGTCMCIAGTGVHARTKAGLSGSIYAIVNSGDCFKFHGGILTTDGYTWYQLQHASGNKVREMAGGCHVCDSYHYKGRVVDVEPGTRRTELEKDCRKYGGVAMDEGNHIHCEFRH